jgi:NitT/TauT family transport system substrate-binding protein
MHLTKLGKVLLLILAVGIAIGGWRLWENYSSDGSDGTSVGGDQGLLGRPLRVGIVTWPGYAGGIVANNGFKPGKESIYWKNHKLLVEFMLMEDVDARAKAFASGGKDGVDIVWSTVDFWANELPGFIKGGVKARAVIQVDWSRGGDAIVADKSIQSIEDLKSKRVSLALFTPSHWLLEYSLENSSLDDTEQTKVVRNIVGKNASPDARADFVAGKVEAAVMWEPDVTEALQKRKGSHVIVSTRDATNLIADLMVAREDFIKQHPDVVKAFVHGWLDGTVEANTHPDIVVKLLMENEPLYKDLGEEETRNGLATVKWAGLPDNTKMFGLDGSEPFFDKIFDQASSAWVKRGYISQRVSPSEAKDDSFLRTIYSALPANARPKGSDPDIQIPPPDDKYKNAPPPMSKPVHIFFATGSSELDQNAKQVLDEQVKLLPQTFANAYIRVEGNTDNTGDPGLNVTLSDARALAVVDYLVGHGLNRAQFIHQGNGSKKPVADNRTADGRAKNRRTEFAVVPRT